LSVTTFGFTKPPLSSSQPVGFQHCPSVAQLFCLFVVLTKERTTTKYSHRANVLSQPAMSPEETAGDGNGWNSEIPLLAD